jgi:hypothetical protein
MTPTAKKILAHAAEKPEGIPAASYLWASSKAIDRAIQWLTAERYIRIAEETLSRGTIAYRLIATDAGKAAIAKK